MEIVRKVVGNTVVEVLRKHYFRPSKESVKAEFQAKFPAFMSAEAKNRPTALLALAIEQVRTTTVENLDASKARTTELLNRALGQLSGTGEALE